MGEISAHCAAMCYAVVMPSNLTMRFLGTQRQKCTKNDRFPFSANTPHGKLQKRDVPSGWLPRQAIDKRKENAMTRVCQVMYIVQSAATHPCLHDIGSARKDWAHHSHCGPVDRVSRGLALAGSYHCVCDTITAHYPTSAVPVWVKQHSCTDSRCLPAYPYTHTSLQRGRQAPVKWSDRTLGSIVLKYTPACAHQHPYLLAGYPGG
eukprot:2296373-Amphidinium_carterae.1